MNYVKSPSNSSGAPSPTSNHREGLKSMDTLSTLVDPAANRSTQSMRIFLKNRDLKHLSRNNQSFSSSTPTARSEKNDRNVFEQNAPPDCLRSIMRQISNDPVLATSRKRSQMNERFVNSLFLSNIDTEEYSIMMESEAVKPDFREIVKSEAKVGELLRTASTLLNKRENRVFNPQQSAPPLPPHSPKRPPAHSPKPSHVEKNFGSSTPNTPKPIRSPKPSQVEKKPHYRHPHHHSPMEFVTALNKDHLPLTIHEASMYFGDVARVKFFDHYRRIRATSMTICGQHQADDDDGTAVSTITSHAGGLRKLRYAGSSVGTKSLDEGMLTSLLREEKDSDNIDVSSCYNTLGTEFFGELQSEVSKTLIRRKIDKEILSYNSFGQYEKRDSTHDPTTPALKKRNKRKNPRNRVGLNTSNLKTRGGFGEETSVGSDSVSTVGDGGLRGDNSKNSKRGRRGNLPVKQVGQLSALDLHLSDIAAESAANTPIKPSSIISSDQKLTIEVDEKPKNRVSLSVDTKTKSKLTQNRYFSKGLEEATDTLSAAQPSSPRTKYLSGCIRDGIQPLPNLIIRKEFNTVLNLAHFCMGDKMGRVLAECIHQLPYIESLSIADNDLTDDSLQYLIESIISMHMLQELDLSRNKIDGHSSEALADYVSNPECSIVKLTMQSADVDDEEADNFIQCLVSNKRLKELDLSNNLLGTAENSPDPDAKLGGVSIAKFISSDSCQLETLKLAWNSIRSRSAISLCQAVAFNKTLTYLDLSNNGLGWAAGEALGDSLMENRVLETLKVSGNNFTSTSCLALCIGIVENLAMHTMVMNENPIGTAGAKMIMQLSVVVGSRVSVSAANCNTIALDERCWYNPALPCREYDLDLSKPFDRAVAFHLCQVVASHSTYIFAKAIYYPPGAQSVNLNLTQGVMSDRELYFDEEQKNMLQGLRVMQAAASNITLGTKLFYEADADHSGRLDKEELSEVLTNIGFHMDPDRLQDIMLVFDVDGEGTIDLPEFLSLLRSQHRETSLRIKELLEYPIIVLREKPKEKWIPPRVGKLHLKVMDGFARKKQFYTMSSLDQKYAYNMAKGIGDVAMMTEAVRNSKLRYNEAYGMFKTMYKEQGDKIGVLIKVIPRMMFSHEAQQLVDKILAGNRVELARFKLAFGVAVKPMLGIFNGFYCLDLSKELHRMCFSRLLEQSQTMNARRQQKSIIAPGKVGDTSQHGNWTAFRNERWNGDPVMITPSVFSPMPHSGIVEFDFSGSNRPTGSELKLSDKRVIKVLKNLCLLPHGSSSTRSVSSMTTATNSHVVDEAMHKLHTLSRRCREKSRDKKLHMPAYQFPVTKALEIGLATDDFYGNLENRRELLRLGKKKEEMKVNFMDEADAMEFTGEVEQNMRDLKFGGDTGEDKETGGEGGLKGEKGDEDELSVLSQDDENTAGPSKAQSSVADDQSIGSIESESVVHPNMNQQLNDKKKRIKELRHRLKTLLNAKKGVSMHAKASRFVEVIDETFSQLWIMSRHLALILQLFQKMFGVISRTDFFGSYNVDIVVSLFARVIDLHNFELVFEMLNSRDCAAVLCRIGFLNLFNPMKPETSLEVDMARFEERMVAKMIVYLSVEEPGINLTYKRFQWKRDLDPIPGWDVTEPWMTEDGLSKNGKFTFTYYSGEGLNKFGCVPDIKLRKALTQLVLIDENEIHEEEEMAPEVPENTAEKHFKAHMSVWTDYLAVGSGAKIK